MWADQGKPCFFVPDAEGLVIHPHFGRMAIGAIGSELAGVNVGMAIAACVPGGSEYESGMAFSAGSSAVAAGNGEADGIMVEFFRRGHISPACRAVAGLTGQIDCAVRIGFSLSEKGRDNYKKDKGSIQRKGDRFTHGKPPNRHFYCLTVR